MKVARAASAALLLALASAHAETVYVTDVLQLGLHRAADTSDAPFASLPSGTPLEVLESAPAYARVRSPAGEGWVKAAFLVADPPARAQLAALEAEVIELREAWRAAEDARAVALATAAKSHQQLAAAAAREASFARLQRQHAAYERSLDRLRGNVPLHWAVAAAALALVTGIAGGVWWLDSSIRRRHGGIRIY